MSNEKPRLSDWQGQYLTASKAYPIATAEKHIVPLLRREFTRAVVYRNPELALDPTRVMALADGGSIALPYWYNKSNPLRLFSGKEVHKDYLTDNIIIEESSQAKILISPDAVSLFTSRCNQLRDMFTRVFNEYAPTEGVIQRGFTLFTPKGGRGRSPELHIDNTILTLHWAAALATLRLHDGNLSDEVWHDLSMLNRKHLDPKKDEDKLILEEIINRLISIVPELEMVENQIGDVMITKGQLGQDLSNAEVRRQMCVHVSSSSISQFGQAGFLMTPQMPKR
jgi:hypothetical protein